MQRPKITSLALALPCMLLTGGCIPIIAAAAAGGGGGGGGESRSTLNVSETEPNNTPAEANDLGQINPNRTFVITGTVGPNAGDQFDGFQFRTNGATLVNARLIPTNPNVDLAIIVSDQFGNICDVIDDTFTGEESGAATAEANSVFQLVVQSFANVASGYTFRVEGRPPTAGPEPGSDPMFTSSFREVLVFDESMTPLLILEDELRRELPRPPVVALRPRRGAKLER